MASPEYSKQQLAQDAALTDADMVQINQRRRDHNRLAVEHRLAHIGQRQGPQARYIGIRKNLYDLRRAAVIQNLETAQCKETVQGKEAVLRKAA